MDIMDYMNKYMDIMDYMDKYMDIMAYMDKYMDFNFCHDGSKKFGIHDLS